MPPNSLMRNLFAGVNRPANPTNPTDLEKRHLPSLSVPPAIRKGESFPVTVEVGRLLAHPNDCDHFVQFVELFADDAFLLRVDLTPGIVLPKLTVHVSLTAPAKSLRAVIRCNLHGLWAGEVALPAMA